MRWYLSALQVSSRDLGGPRATLEGDAWIVVHMMGIFAWPYLEVYKVSAHAGKATLSLRHARLVPP
jgi:hypothetical protein